MAIICLSSSVGLADRLPFLVPATTSRPVEIQPVIRSTFLPSYSDISIIIPQLYGVIRWLENPLIAWSFLLRRNCLDIWPHSLSWPHKHAGLYFSAFHQTDMRGLSTCWFLLAVFLTVLRVCCRRLLSPRDLLAFINPKNCQVQEWVLIFLLQTHQYVPGLVGEGVCTSSSIIWGKYTVLRILIQKPISLQKTRKLLWRKQLEVTLLLKRFPASKGTQHFQMTE